MLLLIHTESEDTHPEPLPSQLPHPGHPPKLRRRSEGTDAGMASPRACAPGRKNIRQSLQTKNLLFAPDSLSWGFLARSPGRRRKESEDPPPAGLCEASVAWEAEEENSYSSDFSVSLNPCLETNVVAKCN